MGCKVNGIISSKIYKHPGDAEIHCHMVGMRQGCLKAINLWGGHCVALSGKGHRSENQQALSTGHVLRIYIN